MRRFEFSKHRPLMSVLALGSALLLASATAVSANPGGIPAGSKLVYNFNVIGYPRGQFYDGNCGNGHRIFVNRDAKGAQLLIQNSTSGWSIVDCNATSDHQAVLATNDVGILDIYVRILGKPGGNINICGNTLTDFLNGETLCLLGTIDLTRGRGKSKFQIAPSAMFDASLENLIWSIDTNADFRILQFRVYSRPF
ncbi:MAG: hypothetical protein E6K81_12275 [Candidatus Eisenbacteria bacterium]|uniref:Uncharacterized protein n=1 Tax=Eiseniibacteriota bacterium TaxID=2212470 RepID=A0A538U3Y7_UNCEI|nr:MAG: hypothetical protein E6K81_12275 [Candidatus Eisenbacteria bacterium]